MTWARVLADWTHLDVFCECGPSLDPRENMGIHCLQLRPENCADHLHAIPDLLHDGRDGWLRMPLAITGESHLYGGDCTQQRQDKKGQQGRGEMRRNQTRQDRATLGDVRSLKKRTSERGAHDACLVDPECPALRCLSCPKFKRSKPFYLLTSAVLKLSPAKGKCHLLCTKLPAEYLPRYLTQIGTN